MQMLKLSGRLLNLTSPVEGVRYVLGEEGASLPALPRREGAAVYVSSFGDHSLTGGGIARKFIYFCIQFLDSLHQHGKMLENRACTNNLLS